MPVYAFLENRDLPCPECGGSLRVEAHPWTHYIKFQWGYCDSRSPGEVVYGVGDQIKWRPSMDGVVRGWAHFRGDGFNVGDPNISTLTVTDMRGELCQLPEVCPACGVAIGGAAIEIRAGLIKDVWVFRPDELTSEAYYLTQTDGSRLLIREWEDKPSDYYNQ